MIHTFMHLNIKKKLMVQVSFLNQAESFLSESYI